MPHHYDLRGKCELLKHGPPLIRLPSHKPSDHISQRPNVDGVVVVHDNGARRHIRTQRGPVLEGKEDLDPLHDARRRRGRVRVVGAPRPHRHGLGGTAAREDRPVERHVPGKVLGAAVVEGVEPDQRVGAQVRVAPVPRRDDVGKGRVAPVLVVVGDAVGELDGRVVGGKGHVDGRRRVGHGIGPEDVGHKGLVAAGFVDVASVVGWRELEGS